MKKYSRWILERSMNSVVFPEKMRYTILDPTQEGLVM